MNNALTRFTFSYARRASKYSAVILGLFAGFGFIGTAHAVQTGQVTITCAKPDGTERTFPVGWDNSNQYFDGKGDIARLFCEGGHAGEYRTFISTTVSDLALRYYNGAIPNTVETQTVVDSPTAVIVPDTPTAVQDTQTSTVDSPTVVQSDTVTVTQETETSQVVSDSETVVVAPSETQTQTSESSTQTIPSETTTPIVETPLPTPVPVVEPQPVPQPVVVVPQPEPQPQPEPEPSVEPIDEEAPLEEQPLEETPVVEEQLPVEEPSELPVEEETNEIPVEEPEILEPLEPSPEPSPEPVVVPEPASQPDIAPVAPIVSEPMVTLDNGVVLTEEQAAAVVLLSNPTELLAELFTNPAAALTALGSVGADMSPEVREQSEKVVVSAIIAGGIATQAASLAASATYRRNP